MQKLAVLCFLLVAGLCYGQKKEIPSKKLTPSLNLFMPGVDGANGATVIYLEEKKQFAAAFAGNALFPLAFFNAQNGQLVSNEERIVGIDMRSFFIRKNKMLAVEYGGSVMYEIFYNEDQQPEKIDDNLDFPMQNVGVYDAGNDALIFLENQKLLIYSLKNTGASPKEIPLDSNWDDASYNQTNLILRTKKKKQQAGFLNIAKGSIDWYNLKNGAIEEEWLLPKEVPLNQAFNFAMAKDIIWIFNKEKRTWMGFE